MVQLVKHPGVDCWKLLHGEVDLVEAMLQPVQQQPGDAGGDGRGAVGLGELAHIQPLAAQTLVGAEVDVVRQRAQPADDVHVGHAEGAGVLVLLPDAEQGSKLGADARLLEHFSDSGGTDILSWIGQPARKLPGVLGLKSERKSGILHES